MHTDAIGHLAFAEFSPGNYNSKTLQDPHRCKKALPVPIIGVLYLDAVAAFLFPLLLLSF